MCSGKKPEAPAQQAQVITPPPPAPSPSSPEDTQGGKKRQKDLRYGLASTIKTSARGIGGSGSDLMPNTAGLKQKLGA
jgi:hypothetical protein